MSISTDRTPEEILARMEEVANDDFFGTIRGDLLAALPFEQAQPFLKEGVTQEQWEDHETQTPAERVHEYLPFAIGKATGHRGLSASRSVDHLNAWTWLAGDDAYRKVIEEPSYENYGAAHLKAAAEWCGFPWPEDEELNRMADGLPCMPNCYEGCGT